MTRQIVAAAGKVEELYINQVGAGSVDALGGNKHWQMCRLLTVYAESISKPKKEERIYVFESVTSNCCINLCFLGNIPW